MALFVFVSRRDRERRQEYVSCLWELNLSPRRRDGYKSLLDEASKAKHPQGFKTPKPYLRTVAQPKS